MARRTSIAPGEYLVEDVLAPNLEIVFCGTALGHESYRQRAYYAHPGNQFWQALHRIGLTPKRMKPKDYATVLSFGLGLTDLCKTAYGNDDELPKHLLDRQVLEKKILCYQPALLAFTSKTAASVFLQKPTGKIPYGLQKECVGKTQIFVLPSPSGLARKWWREEIWAELAKLCS